MDKNQDPPRTRKTIDWEDVRRRIAAVEASLAGLDEMSPEELQKVWARRAAQLAARPAQQGQDEQIELVLVRLGYELYGLDVQHVFDIKPLEQITRVPRVPNWVAGVVNLRGRILSVIDLRLLFGLSPAEPDGAQETETATLGADGFLIVVQSPAMEVALLVDDVLTIEALPASQIQDASGTMRGLRPEYVLGVAERVGGDAALGTLQMETPQARRDMLVILNLPALLADERLVVHHVEII